MIYFDNILTRLLHITDLSEDISKNTSKVLFYSEEKVKENNPDRAKHYVPFTTIKVSGGSFLSFERIQVYPSPPKSNCFRTFLVLRSMT